MPRLGETLADRRKAGQPSLLVYLMAGSVPEERFLSTLDALQAAGVTGIEVGFPFSDPMAEGPVIQRAAADALRAGYRWENLLRLLVRVSAKLPCAVMTYLNPVLQRGEARALEEIGGAGGSALILPDLPLESVAPFRSERKRTRVDTVLLAAPSTSPQRLPQLVAKTEGFLYLVSRYGTTGAAEGGAPSAQGQEGDLRPLIEGTHAARPELPVLVGFGVSTSEDVRRHRAAGADGVIVGSAVQRRLSSGDEATEIGRYVAGLVSAL